MRLQPLAFVAAAFLIPCSLFGSSFSNLVVFGDSLSDNGNAFIGSLGLFPGSNYASYTFTSGLTTSFFTDGPNTTPAAAGPQGVWVDQIAARLAVPDPLPALAGGTNYATGSARTGTSLPQDVGNQLALFLANNSGAAPANNLYALWAGANDIITGGSPTAAADNMAGYIRTLSAAGAQNLLWFDLPLLGDTPDGQSEKAALNAASLAFNSEWAADLQTLEGSGIHVTGVDIGRLFAAIVADPGAYGFSNITDPAQGTSHANDAGYLFWDGRHPTTQGHALVADAAYAAVTATPEPSTVILAFGGLGLLLLARRRAS